ncbi:STAS domain-containing protein [Streptomyces mexicanus]|uniref:STAS domain-containing protein n=1 Tax=Streptomyces mexicanus TaxID=178566 RepID=UPI00365C82D1
MWSHTVLGVYIRGVRWSQGAWHRPEPRRVGPCAGPSGPSSVSSVAVSCDTANGWTVVEVGGDVDVHTHSTLRQAVIRLLGEGHRSIVLDLCHVPFLDSMGLGAIVAITNPIRAREGSLRIACPSARTFAHGGLGNAHEFHDSPQEATEQTPTVDGLAFWPGPTSPSTSAARTTKLRPRSRR